MKKQKQTLTITAFEKTPYQWECNVYEGKSKESSYTWHGMAKTENQAKDRALRGFEEREGNNG